MIKAQLKTNLQKTGSNKFFPLKLFGLLAALMVILLVSLNKGEGLVYDGFNKNVLNRIIGTTAYEGRAYLKPITSLAGFNRKFRKVKIHI